MRTIALKINLGNSEALDKLFDSGAAQVYKRFNNYYRDRIASRYLFAAQVTKYARTTVGSRQRFSRKVRGIPTPEGALFGIDTGDLFRDTTENLFIKSDGTLTVYSDLPYAGTIYDLFEEKGPFKPDMFEFEDQDMDVLEDIIMDQIEQEFDI